MSHYEGDLRAPEGARFAIIASRWNPRITDVLVAGARQSLAGNGVGEEAIDVVRVPGAWEIPVAAARLAGDGRHVAIIALGCLIGATSPMLHAATAGQSMVNPQSGVVVGYWHNWCGGAGYQGGTAPASNSIRSTRNTTWSMSPS